MAGMRNEREAFVRALHIEAADCGSLLCISAAAIMHKATIRKAYRVKDDRCG
jgi:hypothetical protein